MNPTALSATHFAARGKRKLSRDTVFLIGDLLPLLDFFGVLFAAYLGTLLYATWVAPVVASGILEGGGRAALAAAVLAPLLLCDRAFVAFASAGQTGPLIRCYAVRFVMFAGVVAAIGLASRYLAQLPRAWLALWFVATLAVTALTRLQLVALLRRLERSGILTESIAVVGAGPVADRLIRQLQRTRPGSIEVLGVFDDRATRHAGSEHAPGGSVADLLELGKARPMDWILLTLPASAGKRVQGIVHRLKALAVPVGLCPQNVGLDDAAIRPVGDAADAAPSRWASARSAAEHVVPPWILTLLGLPLAALRLLALALRRPARPPLTLRLDDYDLDRFTEVARAFGQDRFGYMVNPNADHLIRLHDAPRYHALFEQATYVLLDSRFIANLLRWTRKIALPVCAGSDLTARLFDDVIAPGDRLVLIGGSVRQAMRLRERYGLKQLAHFNPPMGFIHDAHAVESCLRFVEAHSPFRYCLLAVGAPQQEAIAQQLKDRGVARGLALCIGASIDFLTGAERRAPRWMQRHGFEWLFRLVQAPRRMAQRYLVRGPRLFGLLRRTDIVLRSAIESAQHARANAVPPRSDRRSARPTALATPRRPRPGPRIDRRAPGVSEPAPGP